MARFSRPLVALAGVLLGGLTIVGGATPASAAPPFPAQTQATPLVSGTPLIEAICPLGGPPKRVGGNSTRGGVSVGFPAGARCSTTAAAADGLYSIAGVTPPLPGTLRFSSDCVTTTGQTGGAVDVPAGTFVTGLGVVTQQTTVTTLNTPATFPGGQTAILNSVDSDGVSVLRSAIRFTSGPNNGTIIGRVICGFRPYPLLVDAPSGAEATEAAAPPIADDGDSNNLVLIGFAVGLLLLLQLPLAWAIRRRRNASA